MNLAVTYRVSLQFFVAT